MTILEKMMSFEAVNLEPIDLEFINLESTIF